jgi:hypothetical protein
MTLRHTVTTIASLLAGALDIIVHTATSDLCVYESGAERYDNEECLHLVQGGNNWMCR